MKERDHVKELGDIEAAIERQRKRFAKRTEPEPAIDVREVVDESIREAADAQADAESEALFQDAAEEALSDDEAAPQILARAYHIAFIFTDVNGEDVIEKHPVAVARALNGMSLKTMPTKEKPLTYELGPSNQAAACVHEAMKLAKQVEQMEMQTNMVRSVLKERR